MDLVADLHDFAVAVIMATHNMVNDKSNTQAREAQDGGYYKVVLHKLVPSLVINVVPACYLNTGNSDKRRGGCSERGKDLYNCRLSRGGVGS